MVPLGKLSDQRTLTASAHCALTGRHDILILRLVRLPITVAWPVTDPDIGHREFCRRRHWQLVAPSPSHYVKSTTRVPLTSPVYECSDGVPEPALSS